MLRRPTRRVLIVLGAVTAAVVAAAIAAAVTSSGSRDARPGGQLTAGHEFPTALGRHLERLGQAIPGTGGESAEGPGGAADQAFLERAFPADTIALEQMDGARAAFGAAEGRPFPNGKGRKGTWVTIGPSEALYPATQFRNSFSYVPAAYVAGGRTTSIAISSDCKPGNCTMYITPAGGGVWRTKNALAPKPAWNQISEGIPTNAPTGKTVYVGTGEGNASGDSEAGLGL
jgi:hypothetical protein